ncbi:MAG: phosphatase PAP2 family protein [Sedimentisphaerales bacterium]|nr:phosphatase PAP2 family protein [Sedimentisphaerales bacterium]
MSIYRRNGIWLRLFCLFLITAAGCADAALMDPDKEPNTSQNPEALQNSTNSNQTEAAEKSTEKNEPLWIRTARQDLAQWPDRLIEDAKDSFLQPDNMTALILAGGASIVMHKDADEDVADYFSRHQKLRNFRDESLNIIGHPTTHFSASALWYFLSLHNQDEVNRERAWTMRTALTITWITTMGLKAARDNETPNGKDWAWPSGHTSSSFTVASVLDEFYGPKVGIPAYGVALLIAYRMMDTGDHWGSDVVFGATLGWVVGHTVAGKHKKLEVAGFKVVPYIPITEEPAIGIGLMKRF